MKMLDSKGASEYIGENQGYSPQGNYHQESSSHENYGGMNQAKPRVEQRIPEIDIDEDEIPF